MCQIGCLNYGKNVLCRQELSNKSNKMEVTIDKVFYSQYGCQETIDDVINFIARAADHAAFGLKLLSASASVWFIYSRHRVVSISDPVKARRTLGLSALLNLIRD